MYYICTYEIGKTSYDLDEMVQSTPRNVPKFLLCARQPGPSRTTRVKMSFPCPLSSLVRHLSRIPPHLLRILHLPWCIPFLPRRLFVAWTISHVCFLGPMGRRGLELRVLMPWAASGAGGRVVMVSRGRWRGLSAVQGMGLGLAMVVGMGTLGMGLGGVLVAGIVCGGSNRCNWMVTAVMCFLNNVARRIVSLDVAGVVVPCRRDTCQTRTCIAGKGTMILLLLLVVQVISTAATTILFFSRKQTISRPPNTPAAIPGTVPLLLPH